MARESWRGKPPLNNQVRVTWEEKASIVHGLRTNK